MGCCETLSSFIQAASAGRVDLSLYNRLLSSRDGFLLLQDLDTDDLCLCNPITGDCMFLPDVRFVADTYVLVTGYSANQSDDLGVRIVAVDVEEIDGFLTIRNQLFSPTSSTGEAGSWGPLKCSTAFKMHVIGDYIFPGSEVICRGAIHWLGESTTIDPPHMSILAIDVRNGQTWTAEVPEQCRLSYSDGSLVLATSNDGQLSVVRHSRLDSNIHVLVLIDGDKWMLKRTMNVPNLRWINEAFCPRSGYLLVRMNDLGQELLVDVIERGSSHLIRYLYPKNPINWEWHHPYQMDWSTYLSKMKSF